VAWKLDNEPDGGFSSPGTCGETQMALAKWQWQHRFFEKMVSAQALWLFANRWLHTKARGTAISAWQSPGTPQASMKQIMPISCPCSPIYGIPLLVHKKNCLVQDFLFLLQTLAYLLRCDTE